MKTPATEVLDRLGIPYDVLRFDATEFSAEEAARELRLPAEKIFKTLLVALEGGAHRGSGGRTAQHVDVDGRAEAAPQVVPSGYGLFVLPGDEELNLRAAAGAAGAKKAALAPLSDLPRVTGYVKGGCSPLGTRRPLPVWIDASAMAHERICVSAGRRGAQLLLDPRDLARACGGATVDLATSRKSGAV